MKIFLLIFLIVIISCSHKIYEDMQEPKLNVENNDLYIVTKVDSINNYYVIYLKKDDDNFKVVSEKTKNTYCNPLKEGQKVSLNLKSFYEKKIKFGNREMTTSLMVDCFYFDENTKICREKAHGLYYSEDLEGLCIR